MLLSRRSTVVTSIHTVASFLRQRTTYLLEPGAICRPAVDDSNMPLVLWMDANLANFTFRKIPELMDDRRYDLDVFVKHLWFDEDIHGE